MDLHALDVASDRATELRHDPTLPRVCEEHPDRLASHVWAISDVQTIVLDLCEACAEATELDSHTALVRI